VNLLGNSLKADGRYAEAEKAYRRASEILGDSIPLTNLAWNQLAWTGDRMLVLQTLDAIPTEVRGGAYWFVRQRVLYDAGALAESLAVTERQGFGQNLTRAGQSAIIAAHTCEAMGDAVGAERHFRNALRL